MICNFDGNLKAAQVCFFHPLLTAWGIAHRSNCKPLPLPEIPFCVSAPQPQQVISHPPLSGELGPSIPSSCAGPLHSRLSTGPTEFSVLHFLSWMGKMSEIPSSSRQSKKTDHLHLISELTYSSEWYVTLLVSSGRQNNTSGWLNQQSYSHSFGGWEFQDVGTFDSRWEHFLPGLQSATSSLHPYVVFHLFIFGLCYCAWASSSCSELGATLCPQASHCGGFSCCRAPALEHRLSRCSSGA